MTESTNLSPAAQLRLRMRKIRAAQTPVDHNGRPTGKPAKYRYDGSGLLIDAEPGEDSQ